MKTFVAVVAAVCLCGSAASAAPIFVDDFDANGTLIPLNTTPAGWDITDGGTVDTLYFPGSHCNGSPSGDVCVDLDGSTSSAGFLQRDVTFSAAGDYSLDFWLRGNNRGGAADSVQYGVLTIGGAITGPHVSSTAWSAHQFLFSIATPGVYAIFFENAGGDNVGMWLDDVSVNAIDVDEPAPVPEPGSVFLLAGGLAAIGVRLRRRRV